MTNDTQLAIISWDVFIVNKMLMYNNSSTLEIVTCCICETMTSINTDVSSTEEADHLVAQLTTPGIHNDDVMKVYSTWAQNYSRVLNKKK